MGVERRRGELCIERCRQLPVGDAHGTAALPWVSRRPRSLQPLLAKLQERYKQEGAAPVIELFQRMRAELTLEEQDNPQRVIAWLEEALGAS